METLYTCWLDKKAVSASMFGRTKRRYIALTATHILWFDTDDTTAEPKGSMDLREGVIIDQPDASHLKVIV
eukprot:4183475-Prymnesium_polylepis.1